MTQSGKNVELQVVGCAAIRLKKGYPVTSQMPRSSKDFKKLNSHYLWFNYLQKQIFEVTHDVYRAVHTRTLPRIHSNSITT